MNTATRCNPAGRTARAIAPAALLLSLSLLAPSLARAADALSLGEAIDAALAASNGLEQSRLRAELAETQVEEVLDTTAPRFTLSADPGYGLTTQRGTNFAGITSVFDFPPEPTTTVINSANVGASVRQPLPTAGVLSGALGSTFSASTSVPDEGDTTTTLSFRPSVSIGLTQPLFVDGRLLDTEQPSLVLEQARRGVDESGLTARQIRASTAVAIARLFLQLDLLRGTLRLQEAQRELIEAQLEQSRIRREQGQGSRQESFSLQVQLNRSDDAALRTRLAARELELELRRLTGIAVTEETELVGIDALSERLVALDPPAPGAAASGTTTEVQAAELVVDRAETDLRISRKQEQATARASLALTPRYADSREDPEGFAGAFTDYFGEGGGVDVAFSLGLTVPLGESARRERQVRRSELTLELAERERDRVTDEQAARLELVRERIAILEQRRDLLGFELEFGREQLASEIELVEIGASTELQVQQIRATIIARESELADLGTQLLLQRLDAATLSGIDLVELLSAAPAIAR